MDAAAPAPPRGGRETRNPRRTRRRAETRDERTAGRRAKVLAAVSDAPTLVFLMWDAYGCMHGYAYNHPHFPNGSRVRTGVVLHNQCEFAATHGVWAAHTITTAWRVSRMQPAWERVGAGHPGNRLQYKLWPKLVFVALYLRTVRRRFAPGGAEYHACHARFLRMAIGADAA